MSKKYVIQMFDSYYLRKNTNNTYDELYDFEQATLFDSIADGEKVVDEFK